MELGKFVHELGDMSALEETYWMAYSQEEPFQATRTDAHLAQIAQLLFNTQVKKQDRRSLTDFMLFYRKKVKAQDDVDGGVRSFFDSFKKD